MREYEQKFRQKGEKMEAPNQEGRAAFTDFNVQVCWTRPVSVYRENDEKCLIARESDSHENNKQEGGDILEDCKPLICCYSAALLPAVLLSVGIPCAACTPAVQRGSDGVENRLGCCLTLSPSSPPSPICLGNQASRCREKGRVERRSEENPGEIGNREELRTPGMQLPCVPALVPIAADRNPNKCV